VSRKDLEGLLAEIDGMYRRVIDHEVKKVAKDCKEKVKRARREAN
jgi:hypothetical protein